MDLGVGIADQMRHGIAQRVPALRPYGAGAKIRSRRIFAQRLPALHPSIQHLRACWLPIHRCSGNRLPKTEICNIVLFLDVRVGLDPFFSARLFRAPQLKLQRAEMADPRSVRPYCGREIGESAFGRGRILVRADDGAERFARARAMQKIGRIVVARVLTQQQFQGDRAAARGDL